ncbi:S41 family peptidase [Sphingobacterium paucimobilis]|uniref:Tail specific protease domain-containing protein n=1 Tax=Sphingobacterium paucimobilis HER1398 TaxID=1346330 RepID=U2H962_9SPHI|nr:S41 family peptidase [Sphingobacterium paucimobilis]ERJ58271.1 hypothetical protein M472_05790 [Sphingobacterium paucimobilis HER1398]
MKKILSYLVLLAAISFSVGCKKNLVEPKPEEPPIEIVEEDELFLKDSTLLYTKLLSLWQDYIIPRNLASLDDPTVLRSLTKNYNTAENVLNYLMGLTPIDPTTGKPIDRFSFLDREGEISREIESAVASSYGMYVFYLQTEEAFRDAGNAYLYVRMVDVNSPAYAAGIRRGDRILSLAGRTDLDWNNQQRQNFKGLNEALKSSSMNVRWATPNSVTNEKLITNSIYNFDPVLENKVFEVNTNAKGIQKVGYLAFSSFVAIENKGIKTQMYADFEDIFNSFESSGINSLIVDLRYNGGGSVYTAEYLADKIIPAFSGKKKMYDFKMNDVLEKQWKWTAQDSAFGPVNFDKKGNLNLATVYFLVTNSTASASELLINTLKPHMNVVVIGSENTYGKPVGFFEVPIEHGESKVGIYVTSFQMFNSEGFGDYFGGLKPDKITYEDFLKDFGDSQEGFIAEALYHVKTGMYSTLTKAAIASKDRLRNQNSKNIKNINSRPSDMGMFKFNKETLRLKE